MQIVFTHPNKLICPFKMVNFRNSAVGIKDLWKSIRTAFGVLSIQTLVKMYNTFLYLKYAYIVNMRLDSNMELKSLNNTFI